MSLSYERLKQYTDLAKEYINTKAEKNKLTKVSELENDAGYITDKGTVARAVSDKNGNDITDTYMTKQEGASIKSSIKFKIVASLPIENIQEDIIYLIKSKESSDTNNYEEYIYVDNKWEELGSETLQVDPKITEEQITALWSSDVKDADEESF